MFPTFLVDIWSWIKSDYHSHRIRFCVELLAWGISMGCALTVALTLPTTPFITMYPIWISGGALYAWAAWSRRSFGMLINYLLLISIDSFGLIRLIVNATH